MKGTLSTIPILAGVCQQVFLLSANLPDPAADGIERQLPVAYVAVVPGVLLVLTSITPVFP
jgi:hypothetical protein